jgi:hypothetical protein
VLIRAILLKQKKTTKYKSAFYLNLPSRAPTSLHETDLVNALLPQAVRTLHNDFTLSNIDCDLSDFSGDVFALRERLIPVLTANGPGSQAFYQLLYRVDIPESQIAEAIQKAADQPIIPIISELLIIRALQKAYYRLKFN